MFLCVGMCMLPEEGVGSAGVGDREAVVSRSTWELNSGPLQEQCVLLTTESSLSLTGTSARGATAQGCFLQHSSALHPHDGRS